MNNSSPFDILNSLRILVEEELSSLDISVISEAKLRKRKVDEIIAGFNQLDIPVPDEIKLEQANIEEVISLPNNKKEQFISLANDLSSLSKEIKYKLRNIHAQRRESIQRAAPKKLHVTFPDGVVFAEETATNVFIKVLQHIGLQRISTLEHIKVAGYPLVSAQKNKSGRQVFEKEGYFIEAHSGTEQKATFIRRIAKECGIEAKTEMYKLPAIYVGAYAEKDAEITLELWKELQKEIYTQDIESIFSLETELFPCLVDMRFLGVRVDVQAAHKLKQQLVEQEKQCLLEVGKETQVDVQIWAARSIAQVFDKLKLDYDRTEKTQSPSFTKNFLQNHPHPLVKLIAQAREINKAHTTFIDTILKHSYKGRIHAEINQLRSDNGGTVTGRFSYSNPNLQQIPARNKDLGPRIRSLFIPEEGHTWGCFDYSQQEPRLVVHYAALQNLYGSGEVLDAYNEGDADFHSIVAEMADIPRSQAKTINLGLFYGMGKNKLQAELGI